MNFLTEKIQNLEAEKTDSKKLIAEGEQSIKEKDKEIQRLRVLEERLKKLHSVKYYENIASPERITGLVNQINLKNFLESLDDVIQINYTFAAGNMNLGDLTIWQAFYLLFGDLNELGPKKPQQAADPGAVDPENPGNSFNPEKKFGKCLS